METKRTELCIIIPFYNGEAFFVRLIRSIREAYRPFATLATVEVVIVIDSMNTAAEDVLKTAKDLFGFLLQVRVQKNKKNLGVAASRNAGLAAASSEYVTCMDQDDEVSHDYFKHLLPALQADYDFILCNGEFRFAEGGYSVSAYYFTPKINLNNLSRFDIIRSPGQVVVKRKIISQTGFPSPKTAFGADDKFCWIILFLRFRLKIFYIKDKIYIGHFHSSNYSNNYKQLYHSGLELWKYIESHFPEEFNASKRVAHKNILFYRYRLRLAKNPQERLNGFFESFCYYSYLNRIIGFFLKKIKNVIV
jgi:glycosyltransferase involved in cell wall biosynthesis